MAVTLITGDTVLWSDAGDGSPRLEIEPAPREAPAEFDQHGTSEEFYVIPSDVMPHVVDSTLDRELFNIPGLIRQGLDDESTGGELPVIVTFDEAANEKELEIDANALPAASKAQGIEGIQGAGVKVNKKNAEKFRKAVLAGPNAKRGPSTNAQAHSLDGAVDEVLLDRTLEIDLSESVPQIGAPEAWEAGFTGEGVTVAVLDTGIDTSHPDLDGQVVAAENFAGDGEPVDDHGHGTHVAATVAGTGAASDGARRGVAPDAALLSGKVCNAAGQCPTSAIMAGMEWAAERADIVNMSLGSLTGSDGTDVLSRHLNQLSAGTGTLFVTSAGNNRCSRRPNVGSPAAADAALAVGAVNKGDVLAGFSSCGPRLGDHAVKPEITAPGVGIVAARATGTDIGDPVGDDYTSLSGTSMASPHVAGAAALLAQANPELDWHELKDALVSTAVDIDRLWFEAGTGRVDVAAATASPVFAQGTLNLGQVTERAEGEITYTNHGDTAVTLDLDAAVTRDDGEPLDVVSLSTDTVTVLAGGRASVAVTVDITGVTGAGEALVGGGIVTARGDGVDLRTAVGFGPIRHKLTVEVLDSNGNSIGTPRADDVRVQVDHDTYDPANPVGSHSYEFMTSDGIAIGALPTGTYTMYTMVRENDPHTGEFLRGSLLVAVDVVIDGDTTITLDARDAVPVKVTVPRDVDQRNHAVTLLRERPNLGLGPGVVETTGLGGATRPIYATPAPPSEFGFLALWVSWLLAEPQPVHPLPWDSDSRCDHPEPRFQFPGFCYSEAPAYAYNLPFFYENGIPDDLHETVARRDLVEVPSRFHADQPDDTFIRHVFTAFPPVMAAGGGDSDEMWIKPGEVTEFILADGRFTWHRGTLRNYAPKGAPVGVAAQVSLDWFPVAEAGTTRAEERWGEVAFRRVGAADLREELVRNSGIGSLAAAASRGGADGNRFIPGYQMMDNTRGHFTDRRESLPSFSWRMWNLDTGTELEGVEFDPIFKPGVLAYTLASEEATYRLEQFDEYPDEAGDMFRTGPTTTTWTFTSRPSDAQVPDGYGCLLVPGDTCQIQPLIQLEYDLGLDIYNRAKAGRAHTFTIDAGHHSKAIDRAEVTDLSVQASFDDGETWTEARVVGKAKDTWDTGGFLPSSEPYQEFKVMLKIPPLHRTNGFVTLRVNAEDANGGTVEQEVHRAYILRVVQQGSGGKGSNLRN